MVPIDRMPSPVRDNREVVASLVAIIAGHAELTHAPAVLHEDVISHMDGWTVRGISAWTTWLHFIRSRGMTDLTAVCDRMVTNPDQTITVYGRWHALKNGAPVVSEPVWASYRVLDGRVAEIWTTGTNYTFMLGPLMCFRLGVTLVLAYVSIWNAYQSRRANRTAQNQA